MKINNVKDSSTQMIQQYQRNGSIGQSIDKQQGGNALIPAEKVDISAQSKDLQQVRNAVAALPDVREEKVQELKSQIEQGTYTINSGKVAEKMVGESLIDLFA